MTNQENLDRLRRWAEWAFSTMPVGYVTHYRTELLDAMMRLVQHVVLAEQERIAKQFQAFLDSHRVHNGVPEPPR